MTDVFSLGIRAIWTDLKRETAAFWLLCVYLVVEYLRLHQAYPALDVLPWGRVSLALCFIAVLLHGRFSRPFQTMDGLILAFFLWILIAGLASWSSEELLSDWPGYATWPLMYFLISVILTTPRRIFIFWLVFFLVNLKMSQHGTRVWIERGFSFASWGATGSPGWFQNSGEFAMEMAFFVGLSWCFLWALRPWLGKRKLILLLGLLPGTGALSILASSSRGGQIAGAAVVLTIMLFSRVKLRTVIAAAVVIWAGWLALPGEQRGRFESIGDDTTSELRMTYWSEALRFTRENPVVGIGYGNWGSYFKARNGYPAEEIHNTVLQAATELGIPGATLFVLMVLASFAANTDTRRRARRVGEEGTIFRGMAIGLDAGMIGLLVASQFMSVLYYPVFWMSFALATALHETTRRAERATAASRAHADLVHRELHLVHRPGR